MYSKSPLETTLEAQPTECLLAVGHLILAALLFVVCLPHAGHVGFEGGSELRLRAHVLMSRKPRSAVGGKIPSERRAKQAASRAADGQQVGDVMTSIDCGLSVFPQTFTFLSDTPRWCCSEDLGVETVKTWTTVMTAWAKA